MTNTVSILVYSHDSNIRNQIKNAVGTHLGEGLPDIVWHDVATGEIAIAELETGEYDIAILDGEATKISGMVVAKTLHEEMEIAPRTIVYIARQQDEWLATWSRCDKILPFPVDPVTLQNAIIEEIGTLSRA